MAQHKICAVRDIQIEEFMRPFTTPAVGGAIRSFADEVNRSAQDNPMNQHPSDFHLYELGTFDPRTGEITSLTPIRILSRGEDALLKTEQRS